MAKKTIQKPEQKHLGHYTLQEALEMPQQEFDALIPKHLKDADTKAAVFLYARENYLVMKQSVTEKLAQKLLNLLESAEAVGLTPEAILSEFTADNFEGNIQD